MEEFLKDRRERKPRAEYRPTQEPQYVEARDLNWEERTRAPRPAVERKPRREEPRERR